MRNIILSDEQQKVIEFAKDGKNILVNACIGSGKTTTIQHLCNVLYNKKILYLTYSRLLKLDAKDKIKYRNTTVNNYHGYGYCILKKIGVHASTDDILNKFNALKPVLPKYDVLILDEYQDINENIALMLEHIKHQSGNNLQIIAVGDMDQKIYNSTRLDVKQFIQEFLGNYVKHTFHTCYRLSAKYAVSCSNGWHKEINGVNTDMKWDNLTIDEAVNEIINLEPKDILCLGRRTGGEMFYVLDKIEELCPEKYNKNTVYASIRDEDRNNMNPKTTDAIFTTFDSAKGLERPVCFIFDYTQQYWDLRNNQNNVDCDIMRNIFLVAASRGKQYVHFVKRHDEKHLTLAYMESFIPTPQNSIKYMISDMFEHKYDEDVEDCYKLLRIKSINNKDKSIINIKDRDGLIDLAPVVGSYQEPLFFKNYDIDYNITKLIDMRNKLPRRKLKDFPILEDKILYTTYLDTDLDRYLTQVQTPIITEEAKSAVIHRLGTVFNPVENIQGECKLEFIVDGRVYYINGLYDVLKDDKIYELKFVNEIGHKHMLQCATYMLIHNKHKGIVWNVRNNDMYEIAISNKLQFMKAVIKAITLSKLVLSDMQAGKLLRHCNENYRESSRFPKHISKDEEQMPIDISMFGAI